MAHINFILIPRYICDMIRVLFFIVFVFCATFGSAQKFNGALVAGINISQIDGDGEAGYHKWGLSGGGKMSYEIYPRMDLSIEMLYSQRGSRSVRKIDPWIINFDYIEVPLIYSIKDWYQEDEKYYKARLDLGLSYGYLFRSTQNIAGFEEALENLTANDLSYVLGAGLRLNRHWGVGFRFTKSFFRIYKDENFENRGLQSYFITARAEYYF